VSGSVDGDADRIVFHFWRSINGTPTWRLLDGDKIAALFSAFIIEQLDTLALHPPLSMAVVQTAYANGAAGAYIRSLGVTTRLAKTGVKYVHHVATQYDLAVYFEANGHVRPIGPHPAPSDPTLPHRTPPCTPTGM
jgi:phosphoacetylglucosamine mutase